MKTKIVSIQIWSRNKCKKDVSIHRDEHIHSTVRILEKRMQFQCENTHVLSKIVTSIVYGSMPFPSDGFVWFFFNHSLLLTFLLQHKNVDCVFLAHLRAKKYIYSWRKLNFASGRLFSLLCRQQRHCHIFFLVVVFGGGVDMVFLFPLVLTFNLFTYMVRNHIQPTLGFYAHFLLLFQPTKRKRRRITKINVFN